MASRSEHRPDADARGKARQGARPLTDATAIDHPEVGFVARFLDPSGVVDLDYVATKFQMTRPQLADTVGLATATISKTDRRTAPRAQSRVREMLEVLARIHDWTGGETQAMAWYRSQPIPALDGRTPEALVKAGEAGAVRDYLDHLALGGFA